MEQRPTSSSAHELSIGRRETLCRIAESAYVFLAVPLISGVRHFFPATTHAATDQSKGQAMNQVHPVHDDPYRLPRHIFPTRYDLRLEPDLSAARFHGHATIALTVLQPTNTILFNALELTVDEAVVENDEGKRQPGSVVID